MGDIKKKAIGYIRASIGGMKGADISSEEKEKELKAYAEAEGMELIGVYKEKTLGGSITNQDELKEMYRDISEGKADTILMYKGDKITRRWSFHLLDKERSKEDPEKM